MKLIPKILRKFGYINAATAADERGWYTYFGPSTLSASGEKVTTNTAMKVSIVYACVNTISETLAHLPCILYRRLLDKTKERAVDHPLYRITKAPNGWQTWFEFVEMTQMWVLLRGNGYAEIIPGKHGSVEQLIPLRADRMKVARLENGRLRYEYTEPAGRTRRITEDYMLHIRYKSLDGITGISPISWGANSIGLAIAQEKYSSSLYRSGAMRRVALELPPEKTLKEEATTRLRGEWNNTYGRDGEGVAILKDGLTVKEIGMTADDARIIESEYCTIENILRFFRIQPHKAGHLLRATYSNIEHQGIEFNTDTMTPWTVRWGQAMSRDLLLNDEDYFYEYLLDGLVRGDIQARWSAYHKAFMIGGMTINEILARENMNGIGPKGDTRFVPANMITLEKAIGDVNEQNAGN